MARTGLMPPRGGPAAVFLPDQAFWRLKASLIERTGQFFYADKDTLLWERVRPRLLQTGSRTCGDYLELLADPEAGEAEWVALEAQVTIGETFFFRYVEQFAALRETILPAIIRRNAESRRIRIWSAGCATGPEPYSVAILLRRLLGEAIDTWRIVITGTDISESFLASARQGRYGAWALRGLAREEIQQDFTAAPDGRQWVLRPLHRAMVRFQRHNLLSLLDDHPVLELTDYDLILCRNVLIYFHPDKVPQLVRALAGRLVAEGWLLVGHAEASTSFDTFLTPVNLPGTVAYQPRGTAAASKPVPAAWLPEPPIPAPGPEPAQPVRPAWPASKSAPPASVTPAPPVQVPATPVPATPAPPVQAPATPAPFMQAPSTQAPSTQTPPTGTSFTGAPPTPALVTPEPPAAGDPVAEIRSQANLGDLAGAEAACGQALAVDPTNAGLHFYDGLLARARNAPDHAEAAFRRAIYLYNDFAMAHYHLGLLLTACGRTAAGRRAIATAAQICAALPEDAIVPEGDDLTAGGLRDLARMHLAAGGRR